MSCGGLGPGQAAEVICYEPGGVLDDLSLAVEHADRISGFLPELGWSHYRTSRQVCHRAARPFCRIEAEKQSWSMLQPGRQVRSLLFARLLKSRGK